MISRAVLLFAGDGFNSRAARGSAFTILQFGGANVLRLASNLLLTRLLFPEAFGLMALVAMVLGAAAMFTDLGIRGSVIYHRSGAEPSFLNAAWTFQVVRGFVLGGAIFALAAPLAEFYEEPLLHDLLRIAALAPVIQGFYSTRMLALDRQIQLGRVTALQLGAQLFGIVTMIGLSLWLQSVWALMLGTLIGPLLVAILSHRVLGGHANRLFFDRETTIVLLSFGKYMILASAAGFLINQGDRAVLGKFVSLEALALYNIGLMLATVPLLVTRALADKVFFPLYARRPPRESFSNKQKIDRARRILTFGSILATIGLAASGNGLVQLLYDPRYYGAGPLLVLIALVNLPTAVVATYGLMPLAEGRSRRFAAFLTTYATVQFGLLLLMVPTLGLLGAVLAPGIATLLLYPLLIWTIRPFGGWDPKHDALFFSLAILLAALVLWINWPVVQPILAPLLPAA